MRRWFSLLAAMALLAGCAAGPGPDPIPPADGPASAAPAESDSTRPAGPADPAREPGETDPPEAAVPEVPTVPDQAGEEAGEVLRVPAPALSDLPAALQRQIRELSAWAAADQVAVWRHGVEVAGEVAAAPALQERLSSLRPEAPARAWTRLVESWEEEGRFVFRVAVARREADGRMVPAGVDVIEVSQLEGGVPLVTGYAHAPWALPPVQSPVAVWMGDGPESSVPPQPVDLPAPVTTDAAGRHLVPAAALEALGPVERLEDGGVVLRLAHGGRSAAMPVTMLGGTAYVAVADLVATLDGQTSAASDGRAAYAVEWRPDLGQLCLWRTDEHPIS